MALIDKDEYDAATRAGSLEESRLGALGVFYDPRLKLVGLVLVNDMVLLFPPSSIEGLQRATEQDLKSLRLIDGGLGLRVERLDVDVSVPCLLQGRTGSDAWMSSRGDADLPR